MTKSPSSTSLAESADSPLGLKQPDLFGPSPSASKNPSAKPSSESTGPTRQSTTMSEPSTQMDLESLTSSSVVSPANLGPKPGSKEARKMTVTSGRKWLALLQSYGHAGLLAKMSEALLTNQWGSNAAFLTWKASAKAPSHLLFQLAPSMPPTDATESGLWLTPLASDSEKRGVPKVGGGLAGQVHLWPTPVSSQRGGAQQGEHSKGPRSDASRSSEIVADASSGGLQGAGHEPRETGDAGARQPVQLDSEVRGQWSVEPRMGGMVDGVPRWLDEPDTPRVASGVKNRVPRLKALGNAVVPQVVEQIGKAILAAEYAG